LTESDHGFGFFPADRGLILMLALIFVFSDFRRPQGFQNSRFTLILN